METTGKLIDVTNDYETRRRLLTFEVDYVTDEELNRLYGLDKLRIKAVRYSDKRGLTANSYFWKLLSLIAAEHPGTNNIELHHKYLSENRFYVYEDSGALTYIITTEKPGIYGIIRKECGDDYEYYIDSEMVVKMTKEDGEPLINKATDNEIVGRIYWRIKGTHEMDSKEMSKIIDSVVTDAQEEGIETLSPREQRKLIEEWRDDLLTRQ